MLTLQILDGKGSFLRPLDGRPFVLGSAADADVRLLADGVAGHHARIEFDGTEVWLRALDGAVRIQGRPIERAALVLGDRVELGAVVLVVGQTVARPAAPEDVVAAAGELTRRRERRSASQPRRRSLVPVVVALVALGLAVTLVVNSSGRELPVAFVELDRLRKAGSFELAHAQLERLRHDWAVDAPRRERLQQEEQRLAAMQERVRQRREAIVAQAASRTYAEFSEELQREERGADEDARTAARIVRASLSELLRTVEGRQLPPAEAAATAELPAVASTAAPAATPAPVTGAATHAPDRTGPAPVAVTETERAVPAAAPSPAGSVSEADVDVVMAETTRLVAMGQFRQAADQLGLALAGADAVTGKVLAQRLVDLHGTARAAAEQLLARARTESAQGRLDAVIDELAQAVARFPSGGEFTGLGVMLDMLQRDRLARGGSDTPRGGVDPAVRQATLVAMAPVLATAAQHEADGNWTAAVAVLEPALAQVRERDPGYAAELQLRLDEFTALAALHAWVAELVRNGAAPAVTLRDGTLVRLHGIKGAHLLAQAAAGETEVPWSQLTGTGLQGLVAATGAPPAAALGAAALLYRLGQPGEAEAILARLLQADAALAGRIDRAIARGRGEPFDGRGYRLGNDGFVAKAVLEAEKAATKVLARLDAVVRSKDAAVRDAFMTDALALGPAAAGVVATAMHAALQKEMQALERAPIKKQLERLAEQRRELDAARAFAKELIFDEVKYFYPYSPPQVSADRYAEYGRVQAEVDRRVAAVRKIWDDERLRCKIPPAFADGLARVDWIATALRDLGELDALALVGIDWARALPAGETVTIRSYCTSPAERAQWEHWQQVLAYDRNLGKRLDAGEREQVQITNDYRLMFGHRPLAVDLRLRAAAHGHAEEMNRLGYFSHFSPTAGRKTPSERMQLAGYREGISENIALTDSAASAHAAWCRSSGHHRNLLMPEHTEFGTSGVGRNWVQNFGRGRDYAAGLERGR